jgi:hypothetical protein
MSKKQEYIKYNKIDCYEDFIEYCLRKLGAPVIDINVSPEQIMDRVSDAIQFYREYDLESVAECWWIHKVTAEDVTNGYLTIPMDVLDVMEVLSSTKNTSNNTTSGVVSDADTLNTFIYGDAGFGSDAFMTNYSWNWWNGYWYNGASMFTGNQSMFYYMVSLQYIGAMKQVFNSKIEYLYRRRQRKLWFYSKGFAEGDLICLYGTKMIDPETDDSIWDSDWLKAYATALIGIQWGTNLSKFAGVPSAANLTISGDGILARYQQEKAELEEKHRLSYEEPPMPVFGGYSGV